MIIKMKYFPGLTSIYKELIIILALWWTGILFGVYFCLTQSVQQYSVYVKKNNYESLFKSIAIHILIKRCRLTKHGHHLVLYVQ